MADESHDHADLS
jgi:hypothetical protein